VVTQKPGGTGKPALISSPRFAALPPTRGSMLALRAFKDRTSGVSLTFDAWFCFSWFGIVSSLVMISFSSGYANPFR